MDADLIWFAQNTYHFIDKYDSKGEYMVHRIYICSNLKLPYVGKQYNQLVGCTNVNHIMLSTFCSYLFVLKQHDKF